MYAVCVTFTIKEEHIDRFTPLMHANAESSLSSEPGCRQFDVCVDPSRPQEFFLYELYDDRSAFDAHRETDHFKTFDAAITDMVAGKVVHTYETVFQPSGSNA